MGLRSNSSEADDNSSEEEDDREVNTQYDTENGNAPNVLIARPNASAGYWLCILLPIAFATNHLHATKCSDTIFSTQQELTIAAIGMCIQSLCFFLNDFFKSSLFLKLFITIVPGLITTLLYKLLLQFSWGFGCFWGFTMTLCYLSAYLHIMGGLPRCFSFGEAAVIVQGLLLFVLNVILKLHSTLFEKVVQDDFARLNIIMMFALFCLLVTCCIFGASKCMRISHCFYSLMVVLILLVTCTPITEPIPIIALVQFLMKDTSRITTVVFYLALVALTGVTVWWQIGSNKKASTRVRKIFHLLIVSVYVPGLIYECTLLYIASGVALAIFVVLELFRVLNIRPLAPALKKAFATFSDEKDTGILALTPFCLLIGCSLPIWISACPCEGSRTNVNIKMLPLMAGILTVGFGDTAASVFGSKFGRIKWRDSSRTLEGTTAFIFAVLAALFCFTFVGYIQMSYYQWFLAIFATIITALIEAHTDQVDNIVLPLVFFAIVNISY